MPDWENSCVATERIPLNFVVLFFIYITGGLLSYRKNLFAQVLNITFNYFETERDSSNREEGF